MKKSEESAPVTQQTAPADQVNPETAAQKAMQPVLAKRFYEKVSVEQIDDDQWTVLLDGRGVRTPGKRKIALPERALAKMLAEEWQAQEEFVDPARMPITRLVNTALDGIEGDKQAIVEDVLKYANTDLTCYRASGPEELVDRQRGGWDPILDHMQQRTGYAFETVTGLMPVKQPTEALAGLRGLTREWAGPDQDPFSLAALHTFTTLTGSIFLTFALIDGLVDPDRCWQLAHIDEVWNESQWGKDYEANKRRAIRLEEFQAAWRLYATLNSR